MDEFPAGKADQIILKSMEGTKKKGRRQMKKEKSRMCRLFNCDRRHGNVCCADCGFRPKCRNSCQNEPEKCGCVKGAEEDEKEGV